MQSLREQLNALRDVLCPSIDASSSPASTAAVSIADIDGDVSWFTCLDAVIRGASLVSVVQYVTEVVDLSCVVVNAWRHQHACRLLLNAPWHRTHTAYAALLHDLTVRSVPAVSSLSSSSLS